MQEGAYTQMQPANNSINDPTRFHQVRCFFYFNATSLFLSQIHVIDYVPQGFPTTQEWAWKNK